MRLRPSPYVLGALVGGFLLGFAVGLTVEQKRQQEIRLAEIIAYVEEAQARGVRLVLFDPRLLGTPDAKPDSSAREDAEP